MFRWICMILLVPVILMSCASGGVTTDEADKPTDTEAPATGASSGDATESAIKRVKFTFIPDRLYNEVFLAGTFNGWSTDTTPMNLTGEVYEVTLFLADGEYFYKFVADGNWITDFRAKRFNPDGYGGQNAVVDVDDSFPAVSLAVGDGKIMTEGLRHREDAWERSLAPDGTVTLRVRTWSGDVERVELCYRAASGDPREAVSWREFSCIPMALVDKDGTYAYYEARLTEPAFSYFFKLIDGTAEMVLDRQGARVPPSGDLNIFRFNASEVAAFATPDWVKEAVIYQIFPERFANGDPSNDPGFREWYYEGVTQLPASGKTNGEYFHLMGDWYDVAGLQVSPYKTDGKPDWNSFYGGDIAGIHQNLDYLEDLGITAIYFNPVFEAKSNHKYDAATYMKIDPHFATNEEFTEFVAACHERGIRVIIDLAINHSGHTFWAFVDAREKGAESEYWDWYEFKQWPVPGGKAFTPANASDYYDCWWGFGQMPNFNFDLARANPEEQKIVDIDQAQPNWPVVNHLLDATEFWLAESDIDGYRLDVAGDVPFWFWELFRERVKNTKPDAYIVGELWGASPEYVNGRYYDAVMNYKFFRDPVLEFFAKGEMTAAEFDRALAPGRLIYAQEGVLAQMNLLDSHDTERFLTTAGGDIRRIKLAMLFAMTYIGAPTIYYGDEIAMTGRHDPDCRRPFLWNYTEDPERVDLHDYVRALISLRKEHPALVHGSFEALHVGEMTYAYRRALDGDLKADQEHGEAIMAINAGTADATLRLPVGEGISNLTDPISNQSFPVTQGDDGPVLDLELEALSGKVLIP
jgi:glycosidase